MSESLHKLQSSDTSHIVNQVININREYILSISDFDRNLKYNLDDNFVLVSDVLLISFFDTVRKSKYQKQ